MHTDDDWKGNFGNNGNTSIGGNNDNNGNASGNTNNIGGSQNQSGILFPIDGEVSEMEAELKKNLLWSGMVRSSINGG